MIEFYISPTGKNVIEMGEYGRLTFSDMTATRDGWKWLTYSRVYIEKIAMKASDGTRTYRDVEERDSHVFNMQLKRDSEGKKGVPRGTIPIKLTKWLQDSIGELCDGDIFPYRNIEKLKSKIEKTNFKSVLAKKKKKQRKRLTKKEKAAQEASLAILRGSLNDKKDNRG